MSSDVEAFFKHGDSWPVYEKDGHLQFLICGRRQMQYVILCQKHSALSCLKYEFWCWSIFQAWWFFARLWERWAFAISHLSYETNAIRHFVLQVHFFWVSGGSQDPSTDLTAWTRVRVWGTGCWPCGITFLRVSACHQADSTLRECVIFDSS